MKPTTPTPAAAPAAKPTTPAPATPAAPAAAPKSPARQAAAAALPRDPATQQFQPKPKASSLIPERPKRTMLSPKQARVIEEDPQKAVNDLIERSRQSLNDNFKTAPARAADAPAAPEPGEPAEPTVEPPADPSAAAPAEPAAAPAAPQKVKVGDKEFTPEELAAHLAELETLKKTPAATPAPAPAAADPEPAAEPEPSAEEIAAAEEKWIADAAAAVAPSNITEAELNEILDGGPKAIAAFQAIRKRDVAHATMLARKGIFKDLNPIIRGIEQTLKPLVGQFESVQRHIVTQQFLAKHPDFTPHVDYATQVAEQLLARYPEACAKLSPDQFIDEVARQADQLLTANWQRFNKTGSWRDAGKATPAPAPIPAPAPAPAPAAAPGVTPTPAAIPAARPAPRLQPLAGNPPAQPAHATTTWQAQQAAAIRGRR